MITDVILTYSLLSGFMSILLFVSALFFEKGRKRSRYFLVWAVLFLAASFAASEYALWLNGYNLFETIFRFNFPLIVYFGIWFVFIVWLFERRGERRIWLIFLVALILIVVIATSCMNCVRF